MFNQHSLIQSGNICLGCWKFSGCRKGGSGTCLEVGLWGGVLSGYEWVATRAGSSCSSSSSGSRLFVLCLPMFRLHVVARSWRCLDGRLTWLWLSVPNRVVGIIASRIQWECLIAGLQKWLGDVSILAVLELPCISLSDVLLAVCQTIWIDKFCIDQTNIAANFKCHG